MEFTERVLYLTGCNWNMYVLKFSVICTCLSTSVTAFFGFVNLIDSISDRIVSQSI
jgi:hypothetical protein